ncbi:hypothetical protein MPER_02829, partial [Moniliophthora perniciosa FA553]
HPGEVHRRLSDAELARRTASASARHLAARNCAPKIAAFNAKLPKDLITQNSKKSVEGPYYINNEMVRGNLIEDQPGVPITLDIGVVDIHTCEPLNDVFVELWACNATVLVAAH